MTVALLNRHAFSGILPDSVIEKLNEIAAALNSVSDIGLITDLLFATEASKTISSGSFTATQTVHRLVGEDSNPDALTTIVNGGELELLLIRTADAGYPITLTHGAGTNAIACPFGKNIVLTQLYDWALLFFNGTQWTVIGFSTAAANGGGAGAIIGLLSNLTTTEVGTIVGAINEVHARVVTRVDPMCAFGTWAIDGDGARTNGGGLSGVDVTLTEQSASLAKRANNAVLGNLGSAVAGYTALYQLFPDAPVAGEDFVYFGGAVPFPELAIDISTAQTYDAAGVIAWTYWNGSAWSALTIKQDNTSGSTKDGTLPFGRDGAIHFVPPADWASTSVDSQAGYWIRAGINTSKAANITARGITNTKRHELVTPTDGHVCQLAGTITDIRASDGTTGTKHAATAVKFILCNFTSGAHSGELTWAVGQRVDSWTGLSLSVADGDVLGVVVTQEDGTNEIINATLELTVVID